MGSQIAVTSLSLVETNLKFGNYISGKHKDNKVLRYRILI